MAKPRARSAEAGGQPDAQPAVPRPLRQPVDPVALLVGAAVFLAIALAAWLALFRGR